MSATAPERPDTLTEAEEALLARLDPDHEPDDRCEVPDCERRASFRIRCRHSDSAVLECAGHTWTAIAALTEAALRHEPLHCQHCHDSFCSHQWIRHYAVTPLDGAA